MKKVLITGAYGLVGNVAYRWLTATPDRYEVYGLVRRRAASARIPDADLCPIPDARLRVADLTDFAAVQEAVSGMDVVVHLAATPDPHSPWESVQANNVMGSYHVFEACRLAGVAPRRLRQHRHGDLRLRQRGAIPLAAGGASRGGSLPDLRPIRPDQPTRPRELYAASKVWGEGLAYMYAHTHGLSCIALRIGWVLAEDRVPARWGESVYCSQRDIAQIIERSVAAPDSLRFGVFFGLSDNRYNLADISRASCWATRRRMGINDQKKKKAGVGIANMTHKPWRGSFAIPMTPFEERDRIDEAVLAAEIEFCIQSRVGGIVVPVMVSEFQALSEAERRLQKAGELVPIDIMVNYQNIIGTTKTSFRIWF